MCMYNLNMIIYLLQEVLLFPAMKPDDNKKAPASEETST